ncbi:hypothetical protein OB13_02470 [Pontibacter sp. HJ8]
MYPNTGEKPTKPYLYKLQVLVGEEKVVSFRLSEIAANVFVWPYWAVAAHNCLSALSVCKKRYGQTTLYLKLYLVTAIRFSLYNSTDYFGVHG